MMRQRQDSVAISDTTTSKMTHKITRPEQDIDETGTRALNLATK